jgi:hypothetical protein
VWLSGSDADRAERLALRVAYRCDCGGEIGGSGIVTSQRSSLASAERAACERVTGDVPISCPWRAFYDADVAQVLKAHRWFESGQCREFWGDDPPMWLVLGVSHYHRAIEATRADVEERRRSERESRERAAAIGRK